jgi:hypothetical protein
MKNYITLTMLGVFATVVFAGCGGGPKTAPVTGKVTYRGQPLQFGSVMFQPDTGPVAKAKIESDGTFTLSTDGKPGAVLGKHKVRVTCFESQSPNPPPTPPGQEPTLGRSLIPQKYSNFGASGLEITVSEDMKPVEFNLQ